MNDQSTIIDTFAATPLQLGMLYHGILEPDSAMFLQHYSMYVNGPLDAGAFAAAWNSVANRHACLRSSFHWQGLDQCLQVVSASVTLPVEHLDWSGDDPSAHQERIRHFVEQDRLRPFNPEQPPLARLAIIRLSADRHFVVLAFHHVIADGWSLNVALDEVAELYRGAVQGETVHLLPAPSFRRYANWLRKADLITARDYWGARLEGVTPSALPFRQPVTTARNTPGDLLYQSLSIDAADTRSILDGARAMGVTPATLIQGAWALLLARYHYQERVVFAVSSATRPAEIEGIERIFGPLMAILPCPLLIEEDTPVRQWLNALQTEQFRAREADCLPPAEHQKLSGIPPLEEFLSSMLIIEDMPASRTSVWDEFGLRFDMYDAYDRTAYPLNMFVFPGDSYLLRMGYDRRQFGAGKIELILRQMRHLCLALAADPAQKLQNILLAEGDATTACIPGAVPEAAPFQAPLWDQIVAGIACASLVDADGGLIASGHDLLSAAGQLDAALAAAATAPAAPVAILAHPGHDYVVAILACLRRGSPYALIDPMLPPEAVLERLSAAGIHTLLCAAALKTTLSAQDGLVTIVPSQLPAYRTIPDPAPAQDPDAAMLMVWTSGSTGTPKAPVLTQKALLNRLHWDRTTFTREDNPAILLKTSPSFVDSVAEILQPLIDGFIAIVPDPEAVRAPSGLLQTIHTARPTRLVLTPSMLRAMLDAEDSEVSPHPQTWPLRRLHLSGEPLSADLVIRLAQRLEPDTRVLNIYGSAEVTADVTCHSIDISAADTTARIPIGLPLPGCTIWLLDASRRPVAEGAVGEMHVAGLCLARAYHRQEALSQRSFFDWTAPDGSRQRLYATGDLARYVRPQGATPATLIPLGRRDAQIKIRGVRIEPGEVEARLMDLPAIRAALVMAHQPEPVAGKPAAPELVAYIQPHSSATTSADTQARENHWRLVYDQSYEAMAAAGNLLDDYTIWQSVIDGTPLQHDHMQAWVEANLAIVRERSQQSVVEIGCGQGLLLGRLAPDCSAYLGTDISAQALACIDRLRQTAPHTLSHVQTAQCSADQPLPENCVPRGGFDTALLSSVVQYFPDAAYLLSTLEALMPDIAENGRIILSDLRSFSLNPLLATEILLARSEDHLDRAALIRRLHQLQAHEAELLVDPGYFLTLSARLPRIAAVEARPKPGPHDNELNAYRYDVILYLDQPPEGAVVAGQLPEIAAQAVSDQTALARLINQHAQASDSPVILRNIPHRRLHHARQAQNLLDTADLADARAWRQMLARTPHNAQPSGLDPATIRATASAHGWQAAIVQARSGAAGTFDVLITKTTKADTPQPRLLAIPFSKANPAATAISTPHDATTKGSIVAAARQHLTKTLPQSFLPNHFVIISNWPKTPSNKINRNKLPKPQRTTDEAVFAPPEGPTEKQLAGLWTRILSRQQAGRDDDFLQLGGNSLLLTQLAFSIGKSFGIKFPLKTAFATPVLRQMAAAIDSIIAGEQWRAAEQTAELVATDISLADTLTIPAGPLPAMWPGKPATVFHSGAGGMLAQWILRQLLQDPSLRVIYLGSGATIEESRRILLAEWSQLGFGRLDLLQKLKIMPGALDLPRLGLPVADWDDLAGEADVLLHAGIHINMAGRYSELRGANVLGTREMLRLAVAGRVKPMHAVGSYAVIDHSQVSCDGSLISETTALPHSAGLESDYRKTRWVSETMMQRAQQRGLPVSIHRISVLSGDSSTGIADPGEIAWRIARAMIAAGGVPRSTRPLDMLPIDKGVNAMLALAQCPQQQPGINHIIGHRSLEWDEIGEALRRCGHRIDHLQPEEWYRRLRQWSETHADDPVITGLMPLINEGGTDRRYFYKVDGAQTRNRLGRLGIDLDATSPDDLVRTITYLTDIGALPQAISETRTRS